MIDPKLVGTPSIQSSGLLLYRGDRFPTVLATGLLGIATVTCVKTQAKPKRRMAARSAAIRLLGFMS